MNNRHKLENVAIVIAKVLSLFSNRDNWGKFNYSEADYLNHYTYCILGAIGKVGKGVEISDTNVYLTKALIEYVESKRLVIQTGRYSLNLATFNDNSPYELVMAFLKNSYDNLIYKLDHNMV